MVIKKLLPIAVLVCASLLGAGGAKADTVDGVTFTLVQADLSGSAGNILTWQYDVTNHSGGAIFANFIDAFAFAGGVGDPSAFDFFGSSGEIANGASLKGSLFAFDSDSGVKTSFNSGIFDLNVALEAQDFNSVDLFSNYSATIKQGHSKVPEPASLTLLTSAIAGLLLLRRRLA